MTSGSLAQHLACIDCGATQPLGYRLQCPRCSGLLELVYDLEPLRHEGPGHLRGTGLWRYAALLPIDDPAHRVTLGEGATPLLDAPRLARQLVAGRYRCSLSSPSPFSRGARRRSPRSERGAWRSLSTSGSSPQG